MKGGYLWSRAVEDGAGLDDVLKIGPWGYGDDKEGGRRL
jgi:hypothetical protein